MSSPPLGRRSWPLLIDGGMGTLLEGLPPEAFAGAPGCNEILNRTRPELIAGVHRRYIEAGSAAVETNTFGGTPLKLAAFGLAPETFELNRRGAALAREAAGGAALVIGSLGPSGALPSSPGYLGPSAAEVTAAFALQAAGLIAGGADILLVETAQDPLELRCALLGCRRAMAEAGRAMPLWGSVSLHMGGRMLMGTGIDAAVAVAHALRLDAFGINCATGPAEMTDAVRYLCRRSPMPILVYPNAGIPENRDGKPVFPLGPAAFAEAMALFVKMGVEIIGGCCGTTPEHIAALKAALDAYEPRERPAAEFRLASASASQELRPEGSPLVVGERLNAQGSRKFRKLLLARQWEAAGAVARDQEERGAQVLDVCTALSERDTESEDMAQLVRLLSSRVALPLMIDTVSPETAERALSLFPGVAIVNSVNLERPDRCERMLEVAARYGAAVVAMAIDERGMARTREQKLAAAGALYELATVKHGIPPDALLFDLLTFSLATGDEELKGSAAATLDAMRELRRAHPACGAILGVSNISYGLAPAARKVVNAVFLLHARRAGLTAAIVNPSDVVGLHDIPDAEREAAEDLIFDRRPDALERLVGLFGKKRAAVKEPSAAPAATPVELLARAVLDRRPAGLAEIVAACLKERPAERLVGEVLLPAMKTVGDRMACHETILPHVLQSAEVMGKALELLAPHLPAGRGAPAGKVILATVFGDVHDIGKNLVKAILANNGFEVVDLGKQVPAQAVVEAVEREKPLAVGLSALLVSTSQEMGVCVRALHAKGLAVPVIVGGAAVNRALAARIAVVDEAPYAGGVFYGADAFAGLNICRRLAEGTLPAGGSPGVAAPEGRAERPASAASAGDMARRNAAAAADPAQSGSPRQDRPPRAPFTGARRIQLAFDDLAARIETAAARGGIRELHRAPSAIAADVRAVLQAKPIAAPAAVYGCFECRKEGKTLTVEHGGQNYRFTFPAARDGRSVADWFRDRDLLLPYAATLGAPAVDAYAALEGGGRLALSHEWAALCALAAEEAAETVRKRIATELRLPEDCPVRGVSPGYPLWRTIADQAPLLALLGGGDLGITLTEHYQLVPEFTTTGIAVAHPGAASLD